MTALLKTAGLLLAWPLLLQAQTATPAAQTADAQLRAAESALEHHDLKTAAGLLARLAEVHPQDPHVLYDLGFAEDGLGHSAAAQKAYTAAIAADPGLGEAHVALGLLMARERIGSQTEAAAQLRAGAENANTPADVRGHALRALSSLEETKDPARAADDLLQAVKLTRETEPDIVAAADLALANSDLPDAETTYRRALERAPDDAGAAAGLAQVLKRENKLAEADDVLSGAQKAHPDDPRILSSLAAVKADENKLTEAVALLEPLVPAGSAAKDLPLARELARLYGMTGQKDKAVALYGELVTIEPNNPALLDDYGDVLVRDGKFAQAEAMLQRAVANRAAWPRKADWGEAAGHLAFAASRNHDPQTTLQALAARATVLPNSPASLFLEATAHDSLKQNGEAKRAYRAFLAAANGQFPDEEFEARHRLVALERTK